MCLLYKNLFQNNYLKIVTFIKIIRISEKMFQSVVERINGIKRINVDLSRLVSGNLTPEQAAFSHHNMIGTACYALVNSLNGIILHETEFMGKRYLSPIKVPIERGVFIEKSLEEVLVNHEISFSETPKLMGATRLVSDFDQYETFGPPFGTDEVGFYYLITACTFPNKGTVVDKNNYANLKNRIHPANQRYVEEALGITKSKNKFMDEFLDIDGSIVNMEETGASIPDNIKAGAIPKKEYGLYFANSVVLCGDVFIRYTNSEKTGILLFKRKDFASLCRI